MKTRSKSLLQRCNFKTDWSMKLTWVYFLPYLSLVLWIGSSRSCFNPRQHRSCAKKVNVGPQLDLIIAFAKAHSSSIKCKWPTNLSSIIRSPDTALVDQGADHTDEQVQTKICTFVSNEFTILGRAGKRFQIKIKVLLTHKICFQSLSLSPSQPPPPPSCSL